MSVAQEGGDGDWRTVITGRSADKDEGGVMGSHGGLPEEGGLGQGAGRRPETAGDGRRGGGRPGTAKDGGRPMSNPDVTCNFTYNVILFYFLCHHRGERRPDDLIMVSSSHTQCILLQHILPP